MKSGRDRILKKKIIISQVNSTVEKKECRLPEEKLPGKRRLITVE